MRRLGLSWSRLANLVPVLFGITLVSFVLIRLVPGDPATQILGNRYTPEAAEQIRRSLGLDSSVLTQYGIFLRSAVTGSFGESYQYHRPVGELLAGRVGPSLLLVALTAVLCAAISIPLGLLAAVGGYVWWQNYYTPSAELPSLLPAETPTPTASSGAAPRNAEPTPQPTTPMPLIIVVCESVPTSVSG